MIKKLKTYFYNKLAEQKKLTLKQRFINLGKSYWKLVTYGFRWGKIIGCIWFSFGMVWSLSLIIIAPYIYAVFGFWALVAYLLCKLTGMCPI